VVGALEIVVVFGLLKFLPEVGDSFAISRLGLLIEQGLAGLWLSLAIAGG